MRVWIYLQNTNKTRLFDFAVFWFLIVWFHCVLILDWLIWLCSDVGLIDVTVFRFQIVWFHCVMDSGLLISLCLDFRLLDFSVLTSDCLISLCSNMTHLSLTTRIKNSSRFKIKKSRPIWNVLNKRNSDSGQKFSVS